MVSTRGAKPRGRVNFLCPTSNTVPSPLLPPGEACSIRSCETWTCLNSCSHSVQSKGTPTGAYLGHPSIKAEAKAGKQVHDSFSLKLLSSLSGALPRHPIFHFSSNGRLGNEAPNGRVIGGCPSSSLISCDAVTGWEGQLGGATTGETTPASSYL